MSSTSEGEKDQFKPWTKTDWNYVLEGHGQSEDVDMLLSELYLTQGLLVDFPGDCCDEGHGPGDDPKENEEILFMLMRPPISEEDEQKMDEELKNLSLQNVVDKFCSEFHTDSMKSVGFNAVLGYLEDRQLSNSARILSAYAILLSAGAGTSVAESEKNSASDVDGDKSGSNSPTDVDVDNLDFCAEGHLSCQLFYATLKWKCPTPVRFAENAALSDVENYILTRLILSDRSSSLWQDKLEKLLQTSEEYFEALESLESPESQSPIESEQSEVSEVPESSEVEVPPPPKEIEDPLPLKEESLHNLIKRLETHLTPILLPNPLDPKYLEELLLEQIDLQSLKRIRLRDKLRKERQKRNLMTMCIEHMNFRQFLQNPKPFIQVTAPPTLEEDVEDFTWIFSEDVDFHEPLLDIGFLMENNENKSEAHLLMKQALKEALSITQRQTLLNELKTNPRIVHSLGLQPSVLPELVENNPLIAVDVLLRLKQGGEHLRQYLSALIDMDMSVHSMEVVNRLTSSVDLPKDFLYLYISNCIKTCEQIEDKYVQNRLVRLLCVFLQSMIRNQIIDFHYLYIEMLTFCVEFTRIRESAALYRLMKQMESEDPQLKQILTKKLENHGHLSEAARNFDPKL